MTEPTMTTNWTITRADDDVLKGCPNPECGASCLAEHGGRYVCCSNKQCSLYRTMILRQTWQRLPREYDGKGDERKLIYVYAPPNSPAFAATSTGFYDPKWLIGTIDITAALRESQEASDE